MAGYGAGYELHEAQAVEVRRVQQIVFQRAEGHARAPEEECG